VTADEIRDRIKRSRQELVDLISPMDDAAMSAPGPDGGWAIKDHLAHIGAWEHWLLALFEKRDRLAAMGAAGARREIDDVNAAVFDLHRHESAREARAYFDDAHRRLMAVLDRLTTADFEQPYKSFFDSEVDDGDDEQQSVLVPVAANTYDHYAEHIEWLKDRLKKPARS
jgi:uncharacterized damage-inducible protein DinB